MKKILKAIAIIMCLALPMSAMAMSTIADNELSSVTGQSGVSITPDVMINITTDVISWGDADGFVAPKAPVNTITQGPAAAGYIGLTGLGISNLEIRAREDMLAAAYAEQLLTYNATAVPGYIATLTGNTKKIAIDLLTANTFGELAAGYVGFGGTFSTHFNAYVPSTWTQSDTSTMISVGTGSGVDVVALLHSISPLYAVALDLLAGEQFSPLTIDVATGTSANPYNAGDGITFVRIGIGALDVRMASMATDVVIGSDKSLAYGTGGSGTAATLGSIYMGGLQMWFNSSSYVDIYNARSGGAQGVTLYLNVKIDGISIDQLAWGDKDTTLQTQNINWATPTSTPVTAGWVGLKDLVIIGLSVVGPVNIDVATDTSFGNGTDPQTYVKIGFGGGLTVGMASMNGKVVLASDPSLTAGTGKTAETLGSIYLGGYNGTNMSAIITGNVEIGGHADHSQGVVINLDNLSIALSSLTVSWGENAGAANAGYVGLSNLTINGLTLAGLVTIDVATIGGIAGHVTFAGTTLDAAAFGYYLETVSGMGNSIVNIGLGSGNPEDNTKQLSIGITNLGLT